MPGTVPQAWSTSTLPRKSGAIRARDVAATAKHQGPQYPGTAADGDIGNVVVTSLIVLGRILSADRNRHAIAELGGIDELVHASDVPPPPIEDRRVVARIVGPGSAERRDGFTHREAGELDEGVVHADRTGSAARDAVVACQRRCRSASKRCTGVGRIAVEVQLKVGIEEGANHAVFGGGAGIDVQVFTGTSASVEALAKRLFQHRCAAVSTARRRIVEIAAQSRTSARR